MTVLVAAAATVGVAAVAGITWACWALVNLYADEPAMWRAGARVPGPRPLELELAPGPPRPVPPPMAAAIFVYSVRYAVDRAAVPCLAPGWVEQTARRLELEAVAP